MNKCLYVIEMKIPEVKVHYVKIGVTSNVNRRLQNLQTGNPFKLELVKVFKGSFCEEKELFKEIGAQYERLNGEWFVVDDEGIELLKK